MVDSFREAFRRNLAQRAVLQGQMTPPAPQPVFRPATTSPGLTNQFIAAKAYAAQIAQRQVTSQGPSTALAAPIPQTRYGDTLGSVNSRAGGPVVTQPSIPQGVPSGSGNWTPTETMGGNRVPRIMANIDTPGTAENDAYVTLLGTGMDPAAARTKVIQDYTGQSWIAPVVNAVQQVPGNIADTPLFATPGGTVGTLGDVPNLVIDSSVPSVSSTDQFAAPQAQELRFLAENMQETTGLGTPQQMLDMSFDQTTGQPAVPKQTLAAYEQARTGAVTPEQERADAAAEAQRNADEQAAADAKIALDSAYEHYLQTPNDQTAAAYDAAQKTYVEAVAKVPGPDVAASVMSWIDAPRGAVIGEMGENAYDVALGEKDDWSAELGAIAPANWIIPGLDSSRLSQDFETWVEDPDNWAAIRNAHDNGFQSALNQPRFEGGRAVWELFINGAGRTYKAIMDILLDPLVLAQPLADVGAGARVLTTAEAVAAAEAGRGIAPWVAAVDLGGAVLKAPQQVLNVTADLPFTIAGKYLERAGPWTRGLTTETPAGQAARQGEETAEAVTVGETVPRTLTDQPPGPGGTVGPPPQGGTGMGPGQPTGNVGPGPAGTPPPQTPGATTTTVGPAVVVTAGPTVQTVGDRFTMREEGNEWVIYNPQGVPTGDRFPSKPRAATDIEPNWQERQAASHINQLNQPLIQADLRSQGWVLPGRINELDFTSPTYQPLTNRGQALPYPNIQTRVASDAALGPPQVRQQWLDDWTPQAIEHERVMRDIRAQESADMALTGTRAERDLVQRQKELTGNRKVYETVRFVAEDTLLPFQRAFPNAEIPRYRFMTNGTLDTTSTSNLIEHAVFGTRDEAIQARRLLHQRQVQMEGFADTKAFVARLEDMGEAINGPAWLSTNPAAVKSRAVRQAAAALPPEQQVAAAMGDMNLPAQPPVSQASVPEGQWIPLDPSASTPAGYDIRIGQQRGPDGSPLYEAFVPSGGKLPSGALDMPGPPALDPIATPQSPKPKTPRPAKRSVLDTSGDDATIRNLIDAGQRWVTPGKNPVERVNGGRIRVGSSRAPTGQTVYVYPVEGRDGTMWQVQVGAAKPEVELAALSDALAVADELIANAKRGIVPTPALVKQVTDEVAAAGNVPPSVGQATVRHSGPGPFGDEWDLFDATGQHLGLIYGEDAARGKLAALNEQLRRIDAQIASQPPPAGGMTRLYRLEPTGAKEVEGVSGRWFTDDPATLAHYILNSPSSQPNLFVLDVPSEVAEAARLGNMPRSAGSAHDFAGGPDEIFLPADIAAQRRQIGDALGIISPAARRNQELSIRARDKILRREGAVVGPGGARLSDGDLSHIGAAHRMGWAGMDDTNYAILTRKVDYEGDRITLWEAYERSKLNAPATLDAAEKIAWAREQAALNLIDPKLKAQLDARKALIESRKTNSKAWRYAYKALEVYDTALTHLRESTMYNWAHGFNSFFSDRVTNAVTAAVNREPRSALKALGIVDMSSRQFTQVNRGKRQALEGLPDWDWYHKVFGTDPPRSATNTMTGRLETGSDPVVLKQKTGRFYNLFRYYADTDLKAWRTGTDQADRYALTMHSARREIESARQRFRGIVVERANQTGNDPTEWLTRLDGMGDDMNAAEVFTAFGDTRLKEDWAGLTRQAKIKSRETMENLFFSYKQLGIDEKVRNVLFFHYWMSRAAILHTKTAIRNPYLLNAYVRAWNYMEKEAEANGYPPNVRGFIRLMGSESGMYGLVSPASLLVPFWFLIEGALAEGDPGTVGFIQRWGGFLNPIVEGAAAALGHSPNVPDVTGTRAVRRAFRYTVNFLNSNGYDGLVPDILGEPNTWQQSDIDQAEFNFYTTVNSWIKRGADALAPTQNWIQEYDGTNPAGYEEDQLNSIVINQLEETYGPYETWEAGSDPFIQLNQAMQDIALGTESNNPVAEAAIEELADAKAQGVLLTGLLPGGVYQRYGPRDQTMAEARAGEDQAYDQREIATAGNPTLAIQTAEYDRLGTETGRQAFALWNQIAYVDDMRSSESIQIGDEVIYGWQLKKMSQEEREEVADRWIAQYETAPEELAVYKEARTTFIDSHPEIGDFKEYQSGVSRYEGGPNAWRQMFAKDHEDFANAMNAAEQRFRDQGKTGSVLDAEMEQWTRSPDAYNAAIGERESVYEEERDATAPDFGFETADGKTENGTGEKKSDDPLEQVKSTIERYDKKMDEAIEKMRAAGYSVTREDIQNGNPYLRPLFASFGVPKEVPEDYWLYQSWKAVQPAGSYLTVDDFIRYLRAQGQQQAAA